MAYIEPDNKSIGDPVSFEEYNQIDDNLIGHANGLGTNVPTHDIESPAIVTTETDQTLFLRPDAAGGLEFASPSLGSGKGYNATYSVLLTVLTTQTVPLSEDYDTDAYFDDAQDRVVAPAAGVYQVGARCDGISSSAAATMVLELRLNGSVVRRVGIDTGSAGGDLVATVAEPFSLSANDYFDLQVRHASGASPSTIQVDRVSLSIERIS